MSKSNADMPSNPQMAARLGKVISSTASAMNLDALNWRGFPSLQEFQSWKMPVGTIFVGADRTVIYPDGTVETWAAIESRMRKGGSPPKPAKPEPLVEEVAVAPSPELLAALRRKEWLAKQERGEGEEPVDPQAWRFEVADTPV